MVVCLCNMFKRERGWEGGGEEEESEQMSEDKREQTTAYTK